MFAVVLGEAWGVGEVGGMRANAANAAGRAARAFDAECRGRDI